MSKTYHDHLVAALPLDGTEETPLWQAAGAHKAPLAALKRLRINPSPVSASGANQTGAMPLSDAYDFHAIETVEAGQGVRLQVQAAGVVGEWRVIRCVAGAADDCLLYPPAGGSINDQIDNDPILIMRGNTMLLLNTSTVDWVTVP